MRNLQPQYVRLGVFELDLRAGELRTDTQVVRLQEQPFRILLMLVEREGNIVTREEIQRKLWPNDTIVEFDHSINAAIKKLRQALQDSADEPLYVETIARRGYRLIVPVQRLGSGDEPSEPDSPDSGSGRSLEPNSAASRAAANLIGKRVSHYRVLEIIGGGGMGVVYKAVDVKLGRQVALKFLPEEVTSDPVALERFRREATTASSIDHPNICTIYEVEEHEGGPFIVMQLLRGETLGERLAMLATEQKTLSLSELLNITIQICVGLQAAHENGIIHRDVKPANIFLTSSGQVKILDFGVAKLVTVARETAVGNAEPEGAANATLLTATSISADITRRGTVVGTSGYMSPEQMRGELVDARSDIFAVGVILYEMLTGNRAFQRVTSAETKRAILSEDPPAVSPIVPGLPPNLEQIVNRCLAKNPGERFQNAQDLAFALETLRDSVNASDKQSAEPQPAPRTARRKYEIAVGLTLIVAVGVLYRLVRPRTPVVTAIHQLTRDGLDKSARYGPKTDGTRLYFDVFSGGKFRTAQVSTQGGDVSFLDLPTIEEPFVHEISDDGLQLEVFDEPVDLGASTFWLVPLPKGPARRIPGSYPWGKLLPGGKEIVYLQSSDLRHLYTSKLDGHDANAVVTFPGEVEPFDGVAVSPDGKEIRFTTIDGQSWESNLDGTEMHRFLPEFSRPMCCGQWSRDGSLYVFASPQEGIFNLWAVNESRWSRFLHQARAVQLTSGAISFHIGTPSYDGKQIFAIGDTQRGELNVYDGKANAFRPYLNGISAGFTDFSRDGQWVAYVSHPQGALWRSRVDGTERLQLTFPPMGGIMNPRWSPDGRFLAFMEVGDSWRKIYVVSADGGAPLLLLSGDFQPEDPTWSPDGKFIAYAGVPPTAPGHPAPTEVRILNLEIKESRTIAGSQRLFGPRWSPDGRFIAAQSEDQQHVWLYTSDSDRWRELPVPKLAKWESVGWLSWSHDSQYLYLLRRVDIYKVRIPDGPWEMVASAAGLNILCPVFPWVSWFGLTSDDRVLMLMDRGSTELYALDLEYR